MKKIILIFICAVGFILSTPGIAGKKAKHGWEVSSSHQSEQGRMHQRASENRMKGHHKDDNHEHHSKKQKKDKKDKANRDNKDDDQENDRQRDIENENEED